MSRSLKTSCLPILRLPAPHRWITSHSYKASLGQPRCTVHPPTLLQRPQLGLLVSLHPRSNFHPTAILLAMVSVGLLPPLRGICVTLLKGGGRKQAGLCCWVSPVRRVADATFGSQQVSWTNTFISLPPHSLASASRVRLEGRRP